jgi:CheY-like chemotaxis protein
MKTPRSVLIIDDDLDFAQAVGGLFTSSGYAVMTASNGRDGLDLAKKAQPDLILLDVMMTERTEGFFTLQQIRRVPALQHTPVIVVSSIYADQSVFRVSPEAGWLPASLFLPKPVDPARLLQESARLIDTLASTQSGEAHVGGVTR